MQKAIDIGLYEAPRAESADVVEQKLVKLMDFDGADFGCRQSASNCQVVRCHGKRKSVLN